MVDLYEVVRDESLNIKGMVKNRCLARSVVDGGCWHSFVAMGTNETESAGSCWIGVGPNGTSKACPGYRCIIDAMPLAIHVSTSPGYDGDVSATLNIKTGVATPLYGVALPAMKREARQFAP